MTINKTVLIELEQAYAEQLLKFFTRLESVPEGVSLKYDNGVLATPTEWWSKRTNTDLDHMQEDMMPLIDAILNGR